MIIFLYGEDTFRSYQKMKELEAKFIKEVDPSRINLFVAHDKTNPEELRTAVFSPPFLARRRMVIIPNLLTANREIQNLLSEVVAQKQGEEIILVVRLAGASDELSIKELSKALKASKYAEEFKPLRGKALETFVSKMFKDVNGDVVLAAVQALVALTQGDLWQIKNEIDKLTAFAAGRKIEKDDVLKLVQGHFDENIFRLLDAVAEGRSSEAIRIFDEQISSGLSPFAILARLVANTRLFLAVRLDLEKGKDMPQIIRDLNLHPFVGEKVSRQIRKWDLNRLKSTYRQMLILDAQAKSGKGDILTLLSLFLARLTIILE